MKLMVTGRTGQVGRELERLAWPSGWRVAAFDHAGLDIARREAVFAAVAEARPDLVINAAACRDSGIPLVHISTDYVFDGSKKGPYREDDPVNPLGVYGRSKEAGERAVREALPEHVILRTAWVYSAHGNNFVKTMLRLAGERPGLRVVADQHGAPTSAADIAGAIAAVARQIASGNRRWGTYHFTGGGATTWHGFAEAILAKAAPFRGPPPKVEAIATADYPTPAKRPANSVLDCGRIGEVFGIAQRPWRAALADVIREIYAPAPR